MVIFQLKQQTGSANEFTGWSVTYATRAMYLSVWPHTARLQIM
jgi:hypothetical protein